MDYVHELIVMAQSGDIQAKEQLVKDNIGLIWSVVKRFLNRGYEADDLFQIGSIGLIKCIEKFDLSYEVKFSTYAVPMIMGEIRRFIRDDGMIKVSRSIKEMSRKASAVQEELFQRNGCSPSINEIAAALDADVSDLIIALETRNEIESLNNTTQTGESGLTLIDKLVNNNDTEEKMVDKIALKQLINQLPKREQQVILLRYFMDKTQSEVAEKIGVSQVQVSRIEKKVIKSMKDALCI